MPRCTGPSSAGATASRRSRWRRRPDARRPRRAAGPGGREKIARMDTEEINAIGTLLADLSERTQQLRGYL
jgi:hypothetical protein